MNELALIETGGAAIAAHVSLSTIAKQAQDFIAAVTGNKGESIGTILGDLTRRRWKNATSVGEKAHFILLNIGVAPQQVPLNILQPILEGASTQESDELQEKWAFLLANAADPRQENPIEPCYVDMLNHLSSREVKFLDSIFMEGAHRNAQMPARSLHSQFRSAGLARHPAPQAMPIYHDTPMLDEWDKTQFSIMMDILIRERIVNFVGQKDGTYWFSDLGYAFVRACQMPKLPRPHLASSAVLLECRVGNPGGDTERLVQIS